MRIPHISRSAAIIAAAALATGIGIGLAAAHPGGLAGDGCHNDRAAGERHWHLDGTSDVGGICVKSNGQTVRMMPPAPDPVADLEAALRGHQDRIDELEAALQSSLTRANAAESRADLAESAIANAERRANAASRRASDIEAAARSAIEAAEAKVDFAEQVAADAEARALGSGPRVDQRCRRAVTAIVHGETGWLSDSVSVDEAERAALSRACLEP